MSLPHIHEGKPALIMSTKPYKGFEPKWMLQRAPENSYRSLFRWGDPDFFKYPKESLYNYVKKRCNLQDEEFMQYNDDLGLDPVNLGEEHAPKIDKKHVKAIACLLYTSTARHRQLQLTRSI